MFYIIELENGQFVCEHEMVGCYTVDTMDTASVYNEKRLKAVLTSNLSDGSRDVFYTEQGFKKVEKIHCLDVLQSKNLNEFIK